MRWVISFLLFSHISIGQCISQADAARHVGETHCVSGKIYKVEDLDHGVTRLNFCADQTDCNFSAVVFSRDLKHVGDVRELAGKDVEIHGKVKTYDGRPEIVIERASQLGKNAALLPALPKTYDVEKKGHFSAGTFSLPRPTNAKSPKRQPTTLPANTKDEDPD
jgi:hypothetical protein